MIELALLLACGAAAIFLAAIGTGPAQGDLRFNAIHHAYFGAPLVLTGAWWHWLGYHPAFAIVLLWLGVVILADDAATHGVQRWLKRPGFQGPLHRLYGLAYARCSWLRALNIWLDTRLR